MFISEKKSWVECEEKEELGAVLQAQVTGIIEEHSQRLGRIVKALAAYDNIGYGNVEDAISCKHSGDWTYEQALTFNVLQSTVDTLLSQIGRNKILPRIITTNAKWEKQEKAKKAEKFVRGLFRQLKVSDVMSKVLFSALLHGDGFAKICSSDGELSLEYCLVDEIFVDFQDGMYGTPMNWYHVRWKDLRSVVEDFPDFRDDLEAMGEFRSSELRVGLDLDETREGVALVEAWSLPYKTIKGRHTISCGNVVLFDEEWDRPYFPFIHLQYYKPERGFYAKGLHHSLGRIQKEVDFTFQSISEAQRLCGSPKVFVVADDDASPIDAESSITNKIGEVLRLKNTRSFQIYNPPPLNGERFSYLSQLKNMGFEQSGVSLLNATSRLPTGIDGASGRALREYSEIQSERFALLAQEWEKVHGLLGEILIKEAARNPSFVVKCYDRKAPLEEIKFSDLKLMIDRIVIDVFPASALPATPSAKLATLQEWIQSGFVSKADAMELADLPDLDAFTEMENSPKKTVNKFISMILEKKKKLTVEPFFDLEELAKQATNAYNYVFGEWDIEKDKTQIVLDLLRQTIEEVNTMLEGLNPQPPVEGMPPVQGTPELSGLALGGGEGLPEGVQGSALPPDALAALGGIE